MSEQQSQQPASLLVFSDDWGRHPSSCQHLIKQLLPEYKVLWINTIGTRAPRLDMATLRRVVEKVRQWSNSKPQDIKSDGSEEAAVEMHHNLTVINPRMWPWFGRRHDRRLNAWALSRQLIPLIERLPQPVSAVTTLPITADLPGLLPVQKWVYYCVDDFGQWPGLDGGTLRTMDDTMVERADEIVAVSEHLQLMIAARGQHSSLLTHGVDIDHWSSAVDAEFQFPDDVTGPVAVFWGVVDQRLDVEMLTALSQRMSAGTIVLIGPQQDPDERILKLPNVRTMGPQPFSRLPAIAKAASVLIMPYADLPVTRAMQPLKLKEYLATGRPVVVSQLPSVHEWADCLDVSETPVAFAETVMVRLNGITPKTQVNARQRLSSESWAAKARQLKLSLSSPAAVRSHCD